MRDLQNRIRGWSVLTFGVETTGAMLAKLDEEVAELRAATERAETGNAMAGHKAIREEIADVQIVLAKIANAYGVDLNRAAEVKMDDNERRTWQADERGVHHHVRD